MSILLKNGFVVNSTDKKIEKKDIKIEDNKIVSINEIIDCQDCEVIDLKGLYIIPGLVDVHTHFREPGYEYKETIKTGSMAAAAGGVTDAFIMPNTNPVIDNVNVLRQLNRIIKSDSEINIYPIAAVSEGQNGLNLVDMKELKKAGAYAFSDDGNPIMDSEIMKKALIYSNKVGAPIMTHNEEEQLVNDGCINEGIISKKMKVKGIPNIAESKMIKRDLDIAQNFNMPVHICHVSTKESIQIIRKAKEQGVKVTCEVAPHHFSLTEEIIEKKGSIAKVNPPLRTKDDVTEIIRGIKDGTVDIIATDHAPHSEQEKKLDLNRAPFGISGIELSLSITISYLLEKGVIDIFKLIEMMSIKPSKVMNIGVNSIEVGNQANIAIVNLKEKFNVNKNDLISKGKNTPFINTTLTGRVVYTIVNGKIVFRRE